MANFRCEDCGMDMMEDDPAEIEPCPRCGKPMARTDGPIIKNFGGAGYSRMGKKEG